MELLSPAGNFEKLFYAWEYGADAVYIGIKNFSLRAKADNFFEEEYEKIAGLKKEYLQQGKQKKLYCALNISFHNSDIDALKKEIDYFKQYPIDAFIIQDIGIVEILKNKFPGIHLHLSTQANCINKEAVKAYKRLGFSRIVLGREASLAEIAEIKNEVPDIELECFAHGAMCIAYSGRCLISSYLTGRSANAGLCTHSCRWNYKLYEKDSGAFSEKEFFVEEAERKGEFFPVEENGGYTAIFSSKDLCMIDYLEQMKKAGVDSIKIEGRMKSLYYTALTARAYRKKLDAVNGIISAEEAEPFVKELYNTAHRELGTGFYFSKDDANKTTAGETTSPYILAGTLGKKIAEDEYEFISMNKIESGVKLEYIGPDICAVEDTGYKLLNPETREEMNWVCHGHGCILKTVKPVKQNFIVRVKKQDT